MKRSELQKVCLCCVLVSLALVIDLICKTFVPFMNMPNGGSITIGTIILAYNSYINNIKYGVTGAIIYGLLDMLTGSGTPHPLSIIFDYVIAFGIFGLVGLVKNCVKDKKFIFIIITFTIASIFRFWSHVFSGMVAYDVDFIGSITYNLYYCLISYGVSLAIGLALLKPVSELVYTKLLTEENE